MMHLIQRAVEQAFRLPCRYSYRHSRAVDPKSETRRKADTFHSLLFG